MAFRMRFRNWAPNVNNNTIDLSVKKIEETKDIHKLAEQLELMFNDSEQLINNLTEELQQEQENEKDDKLFFGDPITCNLNSLLFNNIISCQYFKDEIALKNVKNKNELE